MKISHNNLTRLYRSYLEDKIPISRAKCPSPQDITAFLRGECSKNRRNQIIDHIFQCAYCHQEFEFALLTIREEGKFMHELSTLIYEKRHRKKKNSLGLFSFRFSWLYSLIFIAAVVLITLLVKNVSEEHKYRGNESSSIALITPNSKTKLDKNLKFEWQHFQNTDYYILEIFDETLYPIWKSDKIVLNQILLSKTIRDRLLKQKTYYWMVTAFLSDGKIIESPLQDFMISD